MGPLFVILFWAIIGSVVGLLASVVLVAIVRRVTCHITAGRKRALTIARVLPFVGLGYLFVCVVLFSIWSSARGRDWGWGDTWDTPILGAYHLMMIDVTDRGTVYDSSDPRVARGGSVSGSPADQDVLFGVRRLEIRPPFIIGAAAPAADTGFEENPPETVFFRMDTRDRTRIDKKTLAELEQITGRTTLKPVNNIYGSLRYTIIDLIPFIVFAILPIAAAWYLLRALSRLRATGHAA
jgi:hypothetical protein